MQKAWVITGALLAVLSLALAAFMILPALFPAEPTSEARPGVEIRLDDSEKPPAAAPILLTAIGVGVGLSVGAALIGVGLGHWKERGRSPSGRRPT